MCSEKQRIEDFKKAKNFKSLKHANQQMRKNHSHLRNQTFKSWNELITYFEKEFGGW